MANVPSAKRLLIDKTNARIVAYVSVAAFILIFSAVATKTLLSQAAYQNRVISAKRAAVDQLKANITATNQLKTAYTAFNSTAQNAISGNTGGTGQNDGPNSKIVLDALPSSYDFPALTTSLDNILNSQGVTISGITGTDDEVAQSSNQTSTSPQPVPMPFGVSVTSDYNGVQKVVTAFEHSIRPLQVQQLTISGNNSNLDLTINAQTYYQPAKSLKIRTKVVQ